MVNRFWISILLGQLWIRKQSDRSPRRRQVGIRLDAVYNHSASGLFCSVIDGQTLDMSALSAVNSRWLGGTSPSGKRFIDEAAVLARLKHRGIIRLHGLGKTRHGGLFIVMDLTSGGDLDRRIAQGPIAFADAARWTAEAADAIQHAHEQAVIHCDLKPRNLLLNSDGHVLVTDFGLAVHEFSRGTDATVIAGTPAFMAPEQVAECWGQIGPHTDVYGLGAVLYTLLTGRPPVTEVGTVEILAAIVSGQPVTPPDRLRRDVPPMLTRICMRCLAKRPDDRLAHAGALARALRDDLILTRR